MQFPVDVVYTWVDGTDLNWLEARARFQINQKKVNYNKSGIFSEPSGHSIAASSSAELYYSIQSVKRHMPWIRNIYVITPNQKPRDEAAFDGVCFINQNDILPDFITIPTFNSNAIELSLHRIKGLSEHFLYLNDDMFINRSLSVSDFYTNGKTALFIEKFAGFIKLTPNIILASRIHRGVTTQQRAYSDEALNQRFGGYRRYLLQHSPVFIVKNSYQEMIDVFYNEACKTGLHQFRHPEDIVTPHFLYPYYLLHTQRAFINNKIKGAYIPLTSNLLLNTLCFRFVRRAHHFFGLNDHRKLAKEDSIVHMQAFLEKTLNIRAPV